MTRFVPIVVVVSERTAELLSEYANMPEAVEQRKPIAALMERNGWTGEMVLGGAVLADGLGA